MFRKTILPNGLRIITSPQKESRAVTVLVLSATGSKYERKETSGISHFLEHLLFKGTKKRPTSVAISEPLDGVGGIYNAFTGEEYTGFFAKVDSDHIDLALDVISDIYLNSQLDLKELEKEKGVIIEEINMLYDHPSSYVQILWSELMYGNQPAGWNIAGTKESVSGISRDNLTQYMNSQYTAANTIICVAGNLSLSEGKLLEKIKKYFGGIKTEKPFQKLPVIERQKAPAVLLHKKDTDQTHLCVGVRGHDLFSPDKYSQEVLSALLGGMMSSRLFVRIREELALAYYISASSVSYTDTGYLVSQAGVDNSKAEKAISAILEEYKKVTKEAVPASELKKAKDHIKGKMALLLETSDAKASFYGLQELLEKDILTPEKIFDEIDKVSQESVKKVAQNIFRPEKLNLCLIGPLEDKKKFEAILNSGL